MKNVKRKIRVKRLAFVILVILVITGLICIFLNMHTRPAESEQQKACDRAAAAAKQVSPKQAALEGESIDAAKCNGTFQSATPAQSQ
jgi:sensor histidine kinase regulating citrate/malate metabolism